MGRTLNCLRGNNKNAGPDAVNRIRIFGHYAARGANAIVVNYKDHRDVVCQEWAGRGVGEAGQLCCRRC
jgi:hypothetical protein